MMLLFAAVHSIAGFAAGFLMFDEARAVGIIAEELDSLANSHAQVARAAMSSLGS